MPGLSFCMSPSALLLMERVAPLDETAKAKLGAVSLAGHQAWNDYLLLPPEILQATLGHADFLFRRWVLEILVIVRHAGEIHYGGIARALGGLPSGSLSPKLRDLEAAGLIAARSEDGKRIYHIEPAAMDLASAVYTMVTAKSYQHASIQAGLTEPDFEATPGVHATTAGDGTVEDLAAAHDAFAAGAADFFAYHANVQTPASMDANIDTARRFAEPCSRKWNNTVLVCMCMGANTFTAIQEMTGAGSQSLTNALRELVELHAIAAQGEGYEIAPFGTFDMAIGSSVIGLYQRIQDRSSTSSA